MLWIHQSVTQARHISHTAHSLSPFICVRCENDDFLGSLSQLSSLCVIVSIVYPGHIFPLCKFTLKVRQQEAPENFLAPDVWSRCPVFFCSMIPCYYFFYLFPALCTFDSYLSACKYTTWQLASGMSSLKSIRTCKSSAHRVCFISIKVNLQSTLLRTN